MLESPELRMLERRLYRLTVADHLLSRAPSAGAPRFADRAETVEALWDASGLAPREPEPIPELPRGASFEAFLKLSDNYRRPVVIRGFGSETAAVQTWSPEHLARRLGEVPCTVVEMDEAAEARPHDSGRILRQMPFSEFIARMHREPLYLHNSTSFATQCPELLDELELDRIKAALTDPGSTWDELFASNLFVGTDRVHSSLHCAPGGNFFLQVYGEKTWTLVSPAWGAWLFPVLSRPFNHCLSVYGSYRSQPEDSPIWRLPRLTVTLKPGDLLYNPPWWWHEVENDGPTIGCALRHLPRPTSPSPTRANHPLFSTLSVYPKLWLFSAFSYLRHQLSESAAPMRQTLNPRLSAELNRARQR